MSSQPQKIDAPRAQDVKSHLKPGLNLYQGIALYIAAVLGTGILVIPTLAWKEAGNSSLLVWVILGLMGYALANTFASVSAIKPDAGGVQAMIKDEFGDIWGHFASWLVLFAVPAGAVAASHIFSDYLVSTLGLASTYSTLFAWLSLVVIGVVNMLGLRISANVQLVLSASLLTMLLVLVVAALPLIQVSSLAFSVRDLSLAHLGKAAVLVFWSFLGWEAIAHLAEEFENPEQDILKSARISAILVGLFYFLVALILLGLGVVQTQSKTPIADLAATLFGHSGKIWVAALGALISLGTMNAYMAGMSRLVYSMAKNRALPLAFAKLSTHAKAPSSAILFLLTIYSLAFVAKIFGHIDAKYFFYIPNVAFLILYAAGSLAAARNLSARGKGSSWAYAAMFVCAAMIPFALKVLWFHALVLAASWLYYKAVRIKSS